ncbi:MAG: nitroreductase family protein [Clostridia bacterium]|nr:nitroreductase family protein [Clostridia bacterium]
MRSKNDDSCLLNGFFTPEQRERWMQSLKHRCSCRAYASSPDEDQVAALAITAAAVSLPGTRITLMDCPKGFFSGLPFVGRIDGTGKCAVVLRKKNDPFGALYAGISGEAFVLEAAAMGLATCWVAGTYKKAKVRPLCEAGEKIVAVIAVGVPENPDAPIRKRHPLQRMCGTPPEQWPNWAYQAAEAVRVAPSAVNAQPWHMNYGHHTLRLNDSKRHMVDDGIAMLHMECAVGSRNHLWTWGKNGCVAHLTVEDES